MPRIIWVCAAFLGGVAGGCVFEADYAGGELACSDGKCPSGLSCNLAEHRCRAPVDAALDTPDAMIDARQEALTCADPGVFAATGGARSGTTTGRTSLMSSMCGGFVMNGPDAVFEIDLAAGKTLLVTITAGSREAYVIGSCLPTPNTPACLGNARATLGNPLSVTPAAGPSYVVVDDDNAAASGDYTLSLTVD